MPSSVESGKPSISLALEWSTTHFTTQNTHQKQARQSLGNLCQNVMIVVVPECTEGGWSVSAETGCHSVPHWNKRWIVNCVLHVILSTSN